MGSETRKPTPYLDAPLSEITLRDFLMIVDRISSRCKLVIEYKRVGEATYATIEITKQD